MIKSETIEIDKPEHIDNRWIEERLKPLDIVRWAIVCINNKKLKVCVSYKN
ncbi:MAG: hypothetical protein LBJ74_01530 [Heliobacteriaceae bacterium]|jgi:hypothetical protein|nr:hypothetical protein [Heliobacteriaceae bacterium]